MKTALKVICTCLFICSFFINCSAQTPGYMGKKLSLGYGLYANPAFNSIVSDYSDRPINILHEFFVEYVVRKKTSLGLSTQFYNYTYNNIEKADIYAGNYGYVNRTIDAPEGSYQIKGRNYKVYGKFYQGKYLAPWGKYLLLGLVLNQYTTSYDSSSMYAIVDAYLYNYKYPVIYRDWGPISNTHRTVDVFSGVGSSRILANHIVLDYGLVFETIAVLKMIYDYNNDFIKLYEGIPARDYISETSEKRVAAINRFNFYFKIGYLF